MWDPCSSSVSVTSGFLSSCCTSSPISYRSLSHRTTQRPFRSMSCPCEDVHYISTWHSYTQTCVDSCELGDSQRVVHSQNEVITNCSITHTHTHTQLQGGKNNKIYLLQKHPAVARSTELWRILNISLKSKQRLDLMEITTFFSCLYENLFDRELWANAGRAASKFESHIHCVQRGSQGRWGLPLHLPRPSYDDDNK